MTWYEIQYSHKDANDWYATNNHADTIETAKNKIANIKSVRVNDAFEYRIVRKTLIEETVNV